MYKLYIKKNISTSKLLHSILKEYNLKEEIIYNSYGKPYLKNNELYFNLSNSGKYTICAISTHEIGVDIQKISYKKKVIKHVCNEVEAKLIHNANDFTQMWVKKESYVKYLGMGLSYGLKNVDTLKLKDIDILKFANYYIAVCYGKN